MTWGLEEYEADEADDVVLTRGQEPISSKQKLQQELNFHLHLRHLHINLNDLISPPPPELACQHSKSSLVFGWSGR
jgi:hypothetical protein